MKYKLLVKHYLTVVSNMPFNRLYEEGAIFEKHGETEDGVILKHEGAFVVVSKALFGTAFEPCWGDTCLIKGMNDGTQTGRD